MKVHLRLITVGHAAYRVVSLRPSDDVRFSNNYFHDTWHILGDRRSARTLARLMWGLAYQRQPGTVVAVHGPHLSPSPFSGEQSFPVLLFNSLLTPVRPKHFRHLRRALSATGPTRTIRWQTFGMDLPDGSPVRYPEGVERMLCRNGMICYAASPEHLRRTARWTAGLNPDACPGGMDYVAIADWDGEVQVFSDYRRHLSAAGVARREVLSDGGRPTDAYGLEMRIYRRRQAVLRRRH